MNPDDFKRRTKAFGLAAWRLFARLPQTSTAQIPGRQLLRAATSVGANYRAACRARSAADFVAKMKIVEEECDESLYWLELLLEIGGVNIESITLLRSEGNEILSITVASIRTARSHQSRAL